MHHIVYQTTNLINGKIYVGVHSTDDLNDGYLGSGKYLQRAINKYGCENFERKILFNCKALNTACWLESIIVNFWFIEQDWNYNLAFGGIGFYITNKTKTCKQCNKKFIATHNQQKYCSDICIKNNYRQYYLQLRKKKGQKTTDIPRKCEWCDDYFIGSTNQKYCCAGCRKDSLNYRNRQNRKKTGSIVIGDIIQCSWCNIEFTVNHNQYKYCSKQCAEKGYEKYKNKYKREYHIKKGMLPLDITRCCKLCNIEFVATTPNQKYCNKKCSKLAKKIIARNYKKLKKFNPSSQLSLFSQ